MYEERPELRDGLVDLGLLPEYARTGLLRVRVRVRVRVRLT